VSGKTLVAFITALTLAGSSGCQMGSGSSVTGLFSGRGEGTSGEALSPEFREAQKTFRRNTPKALLAWARYQEDVGEYSEALRRYRELTVAYPESIDATPRTCTRGKHDGAVRAGRADSDETRC
jgi:hypothetical protein